MRDARKRHGFCRSWLWILSALLAATSADKRTYVEPQDTEWAALESPAERVAWCKQLQPLYENIAIELKPWRAGISFQLQMSAVRHHTARVRGQKGIAVGFLKGRAYVTDWPNLKPELGHHNGLFFVQMKVMLHLEQLFGPLLPDVEFVISNVDRPLSAVVPPASSGRRGAPAAEPEPVFRFCTTGSHTDLTIPNFHSYIKAYTAHLRPQMAYVNTTYPWGTRQPILFGRFSAYDRHMHTDDPHTRRKGAGGNEICTSSEKVTQCQVRQHFCEYAANHSDVMDVSCQKRTAMVKHAQYKYLVHLDGQGLSSRFEQLIHLNSLVFKEESGYRAYFYRLLKPGVHYVPFWKTVPDDILTQLAWAKANDRKAQQIARNAQAFARRYLGTAGRACYWHQLLTQYAALLQYKPGPNSTSKFSQFWVPVEEYLKTTAQEFEGGRWYDFFKFVP